MQVDKEDVVMGRPQDPSLSVFWMVYARAEDGIVGTEGGEAVEESLVTESMKAAIADDNLTYESELLSLIRSDAATPASTVEDVNGVVPPTDANVTVATGVGPDSADVTMTADLGSEAPKSPRTG